MRYYTNHRSLFLQLWMWVDSYQRNEIRRKFFILHETPLSGTNFLSQELISFARKSLQLQINYLFSQKNHFFLQETTSFSKNQFPLTGKSSFDFNSVPLKRTHVLWQKSLFPFTRQQLVVQEFCLVLLFDWFPP